MGSNRGAGRAHHRGARTNADRVERPRGRPSARLSHWSGVEERLEARRILVTGGSLGIGLEVSRELARRGARVIVAARGIDAIEAAIDALEGSGHEGISLDVSESSGLGGGGRSGSMPAAGSTASSTAAGVLGPIGALEDVPAADLIETIAINLVGTVLALRFALPRLRAERWTRGDILGRGWNVPAAALRRLRSVQGSGRPADRERRGERRDRDQRGRARVRRDANARRDAPSWSRGRRSELLRAYREQLRAGGFPASEAAELVAFLMGPERGRDHRTADQRSVGPVEGRGLPGTPAKRLRPGEVATNR